MKMELEKEKYIKLLLAIWIILSHLPGMKLLSVYNYLPVAGFFFLSGYGLMSKSINNSKYDFKKSLIKIYIPYIIATFIYVILFSNYDFIKVIKELFLINIDLPYGWYIRTQIIIYIIWFLANKIKNNNTKILFVFALLMIYSIIFRYTGQILTSYKTVFAFVFGLIYCQYENEISKKITIYNFIIFGLISLILKFFISSKETIIDMVIYNVSGILFCVSLVYVIYNFSIKSKILSFLKNMSLEAYLVQGISQCIFMKTYFCNKSYLYLNNNFLIIFLSFLLTFIFGYLLNKLDLIIFNFIYRRKKVEE